MDTTEKHRDDEHQMEVYVQFLPSAEVKMFTASTTTTIRDLKVLSEEKCGIPSDVLIFMHETVLLCDDTALSDLGCSEYVLLDLFIKPLWEKFVRSCVRGENGRVMARVHIKMNQLSTESRAFVAAFIAAHKGNSDLLQLLVEAFKEEMIHQTVHVSGRSLLHAAVLGGNISCVMTLVINGGWNVLDKADSKREAPLQVAQRMKKEEGLVQILRKYNDIYFDRHWEPKERGVHRDDKQAGDHKDPTSGNQEVEILPKQPIQKKSEDAGISHRMLHRDARPHPRVLIPVPPTDQDLGSSPDSPVGSPKTPWCKSRIERAGSVKLPVIHTENASICFSSKSPRGRLIKNVERPRSPSSPTPKTKSTPAKPAIERSRTRSEYLTRKRCDLRVTDSSCLLSSSAPNSPILRKRQTLPIPSLARSRSPSGFRSELAGSQEESRFFSRQLQLQLMTFDKTREALPWNAWKTVKGDVTLEKSFADEEDEEEKIRKYQQMSGYRKSFQVWLAEKAAQKAKEQSDAENEAKRLAENKTLEEMQRRMKAKTFDQWIREKDATGVQPKSDDDATDAEKEARRTQASLKYQEWMRKKDAEALEQEEVMRLEEQRKYEQLKKKREEESRTKWPRKTAIFKVNSLPV